MNYYDSIHNCTIKAFKDKTNTGDLKHIHINGDYNEEEAKQAWLKIYDEWDEALETNRNNVMLEYSKQLYVLKYDYFRIQTAIDMIERKIIMNAINKTLDFGDKYDILDYDLEIEVLNKKQFKLSADNIEVDIIRVKKQAKTYNTKIKILEDKIEKENEGSKKSTINKTIFKAQKHQGYPFRDDAKVIDLVECLNDIIEEQRIIKANNKRKRNS